MSVSEVVREFADRLSDELSGVEGRTSDGSGGGSLAGLLANASPAGIDDGEVLAVLVEGVRLLNVANVLLAQTVQSAVRVGVPMRKRLKTGADLLLGLGVPPAVAYRLARVGKAFESVEALAGLAGQALVGGVAIEHADAVGEGLTFVGKRVELDPEAEVQVARRLIVQERPGDVRARAREIAIELAPTAAEVDPEVVPVAENAELNEMSVVVGADGRTSVELDVDVVLGEELWQALDPLCRPVLAPDGSRDPRNVGQRRADAFGQIVRMYLAGSDRPTNGGVLPHVSLLVPVVAESGSGSSGSATGVAQRGSVGSGRVASLGFTGPVSDRTVGLVLCDSALRRIGVDGQGAVLDVGREHRTVTVPIRKALEARDRGCAAPGCGRPVGWTDAHHIVPWSQGGETSVENSVLLCRMHHTMVHHGGWEVFLGTDHHPWFVVPANPARPGGQRRIVRSHARRTLTLAEDAAA
ncbi:MAG: DUF222 domain-containing protein [Gordonia sp. (in: high G+C Gram-positive bacteria)]|uniref:HNH endonuclease signature motif containing protein n=1 Tax=Gordonia sp. (in: high G+C Gram-positive bacteria) TaxID=84139 RepID=UPI003C7521B0